MNGQSQLGGFSQAATDAATAKILRLGAAENLTSPTTRAEALATLEHGGLVVLLDRGFELTASERRLIANTREMIPGISVEDVRNGKPTIIYEPWRGRIKHRRYTRSKERPGDVRPDIRSELEPMMRRFGTWATSLVAELFPSYPSSLAEDRITYRPHERSALQPLHVDSSYGYPTRGRGMFRLFCNIDPSGRPRVWQVGEPFETFARRFITMVRLRDPGWKDALIGRLPFSRWQRSLYDDVIAELRLHGKRDQDYQRTAPREIVEFPSGSCWFAITDLVLHGAVSGRHSLDQTFFLPAAAMEKPERSSLYTLEKLLGRALT